MSTFTWKQLCSENRLGLDGEDYNRAVTNNESSVFQRDYERILTSSAFRRLQGKTQVYPFPNTDFVRNRLTHTLEVAHIGRTLATIVVNKSSLVDNQDIKDHIPQIVANGCLLHDIGNPPFGHSGESSIREFFGDERNRPEIVNNAFKNETCKNDLLFFDGNAQGFRVATRLSGWRRKGGLRLSAATLTAMIKYPFSSSEDNAPKGKFGFMHTETAYATEIFLTCGLYHQGQMYRNPLSLIVEAADDIAYLTSDIQDAHRYGDIKFANARSLLDDLTSEDSRRHIHDITKEDEDYEENVLNYLRSIAVSNMIKASAESLKRKFKDRSNIKSTEKFAIWTNAPPPYDTLSSAEEAIRYKSRTLVYRGKRKVAVQVAGGRIIKFVLDMQINALQDIFFSLHSEIMKYPNITGSVEKSIGSINSIESYSKHLVDHLEDYVSRESAQIFWGMPPSSYAALKNILSDCYSNQIASADAEISYRVIQISLDFVSGTTDRYISEYSKQWSGPAISS